MGGLGGSICFRGEFTLLFLLYFLLYLNWGRNLGGSLFYFLSFLFFYFFISLFLFYSSGVSVCFQAFWSFVYFFYCFRFFSCFLWSSSRAVPEHIGAIIDWLGIRLKKAILFFIYFYSFIFIAFIFYFIGVMFIWVFVLCRWGEDVHVTLAG